MNWNSQKSVKLFWQDLTKCYFATTAKCIIAIQKGAELEASFCLVFSYSHETTPKKSKACLR